MIQYLLIFNNVTRTQIHQITPYNSCLESNLTFKGVDNQLAEANRNIKNYGIISSKHLTP